MAKGVACTLLTAQVWFEVDFDSATASYQFTVDTNSERFLPVGWVREPVKEAP